MDTSRIRNFSIIAHIDHGKSTLADRFLEITETIEKRKMKEQVLDSMELERERGITIKMQPVRMKHNVLGTDYVFNLIDTPGHIDFSYEVSRALKAVEGVILLVDATQGVQAQTMSVLGMAQELGLVVLPVVSKIDSPLAEIDRVKKEVALLLQCSPDDVLGVSGKTGEGVLKLLEEIVKKVPPPQGNSAESFKSLVFDFQYDNHRGVIVYIRVMAGSLSRGEKLIFKASRENFNAIEVGIFSPDEVPVESLGAGEIGYIVTGIKEPGVASVGDTVTGVRDMSEALPGYMNPRPVVWASIYPESQDHFNLLRQALGRLRLSDSSLSYEEESSGALGRGFRCGFLGMLHLEIIVERLRREFNLVLVVTMPSITYEVVLKGGKKQIVYSPHLFPDDGSIERVFEPWVTVSIISPSGYLGGIIQLLHEHEAEVGETESFGDNRTRINVLMPLRELMRGFFDEMKSVSSGFASISYEIGEMREADVVKLDMLVADEPVPAFTRVVSRRKMEDEAEKAVEKLYGILPKQMFTTKIQAKGLGRIISSRTLTAIKKNVTGHLYGGDITRKKKLWEKQKEGKKRMKAEGTVNIPHDVFLKMMKSE
ncbi:MAG: hypothetical protein RJA61_478 [Candidatus Parcubacteria bacterium]|jgi:GTP-binding protein LepA